MNGDNSVVSGSNVYDLGVNSMHSWKDSRRKSIDAIDETAEK